MNTLHNLENKENKEQSVSIKILNETQQQVKQKKQVKQKEPFYDSWLVSNSNNLIFYGIIIIIVISVIYLAILSFINRDFDYPINHPFLFTLETLLTSFGVGAIIIFMAWGRNKFSYDTYIQFLIVVLKFGIIHILLQFSGTYTYIFKIPTTPS